MNELSPKIVDAKQDNSEVSSGSHFFEQLAPDLAQLDPRVTQVQLEVQRLAPEVQQQVTNILTMAVQEKIVSYINTRIHDSQAA